MIERLYPGVYVAELPTEARPIEGVNVSTGPVDGAAAQTVHPHTPEWTDHNQSDPGVTLVQLCAFLGETLLYRAHALPDRTAHAHVVAGAAHGLAVSTSDSGEAPQVQVSPGQATTADGRPIEPDPR